MSDTPIYDAIRRERSVEAMRRVGETMGQFADMLKAFGEGFREGKKAASAGGAPSTGSSTPEVSAESASRHSLQDSSRPEGSRRVDTRMVVAEEWPQGYGVEGEQWEDWRRGMGQD